MSALRDAMPALRQCIEAIDADGADADSEHRDELIDFARASLRLLDALEREIAAEHGVVLLDTERRSRRRSTEPPCGKRGRA